MKAKQIITAAILTMAASVAFAQQGEVKIPSSTATPVHGKTRAEVRAELKDAPLFSNRALQR